MAITKLPSGAFESNIAPNDIINDISTLALREATTENRVAYSSNSSSIDVFQDATGIDATSSTSRNSVGEYVSSLTSVISPKRYWRAYKTSTPTNGSYHSILQVFSGADHATQETITAGMLSSSGVAVTNGLQNLLDGNTQTVAFHTDSAAVGSTVTIDFGAGNEKALTRWFFNYNSYTNASWRAEWSSDNSNWTAVTTGIATGVNMDWDAVTNDTLNATGNFTGATITAPSSVSKMGGIFTYQDTSGTNALNTDIILQLSADGGSNFTTTTLTALPDFSTGIKMAKANDVTVTTGTSLKYKILFANQSSGSKEARIRGVSLQY
ncbi:putative hydrolase [uncultured Mediterranean phage uvMED]|nr:putative hydrolase [uncultured Mediterranean phage uvMED]